MNPNADGRRHEDPYAEPGERRHRELPKSDREQLLLIIVGVSYLLCGIFTAIPGLVIAHKEKSRMERGEIAHNQTIVVAYWLLIGNLALHLLIFVGFLAIFGVAVGSAFMEAPGP